MTTKRKLGLYVAAALVLYVGGYLFVRTERVLVHQQTFQTDPVSGEVSYHHRIIEADFGVPMLAGQRRSLGASLCHFVFTPMRWIEAYAWHAFGGTDP